MTTYDLAIIGGGPAGYVAAIRAAQLGLKTVCIEKRPRLGGTCLNVGCIPSKTLLHDTEHGTPPISQLMERKEKVISGLAGGIAGLFRKNKIDHIEGHARFIDATTISVGDKTVTAKNIIIATGSEPTPLPFLPFDEERIVSSTGALSLSQVPKKMVVVGAGVIGLELGSVYRRLGSEVTFVEFLPQVCPSLDPDMAKALQKIMEKQDLTFNLSTKVTSGTTTPTGVTLETDKGTFDADIALISIGRRPFTQDLNLDAIGITTDKAGRIPINGRFQTSHSHIYAIGDVVDGAMLAHKAEEEGIAAVEIIAGMHPHINYVAIPNVLYTNPEVATVGLTETEAKRLGLTIRTGSFPMKANSRAHCTGSTDGLVKIISDATTDQLLGMHIISSHASEMIGEGVVAIEKKVTTKELAYMSHAHPTHSEAIKEACLSVYKAALHI